MQKKIKSFTVLDDGYVVIQLAKKNDVDTYMASLIQKNKGLLPCVQDQKAKSKFYYDRRKFASLTDILNTYHFRRNEAITFLQHLFQHIQDVEEEYPIVLELDCVYVQQDLSTMAIVALPIHEHRNQENDMYNFLCEIMKLLHAEDEVNILGRLSLCLRNTNLSTYTILQELQRKFNNPLLTLLRWREQQQASKDRVLQNQLAMEELFSSLQRSYEVYKAPVEVKKDVSIQNETVELFPAKKVSCYLKDVNTTYELDGSKAIGRSEDCDIQIVDPAISSHHAMIHVEKDRVYLEDMCSSNGTCINKEVLQANQRYLLHHQDVILFAGIEMTFYKEKNANEQ